MMRHTELPDKMFTVTYLVRSVIFVVLFSILYMAVYTQFSVSAWFDLTDTLNMILTILYYMVGIVMMLGSKYLFWRVHRSHRTTYYIYVLWTAAEAVLLAATYTALTVATDMSLALSPLAILLRSTICLLLIMFIPTSIYALFVSLKVEKARVKVLVETASDNSSQTMFVSLSDYNNNLKCTVDINSVYYIESQQNYVKIYYDKDGVLDSHMLRCGTKNIEKQLADTSLVRCHRSFIVNTRKIKMLSKTRGGTFIELQLNGVHIPVSSKYYDDVAKMLNNQ